MWLDEADGFAELFKGYIPFYLLVALPIFIMMAPVKPAAASHEFSVYRMQQYDLHSVPHGCRSSSINLEGRSLTSWATSRHCVVARIQDITIDQLMEIRAKAGGLLLVLPKNDTSLTLEEKEHIQLLEMAMAQQEFTVPVYFTQWSQQVDDIIADLQYSFITDDKSGTALEAMVNSVSSNGYQIVVSSPAPFKLESKPVTLHAKLSGSSATAQTIVIVAHYDANAVAPELATGADSNASGATALVELARVFSRLYAAPATRGSSSLVFALTGTGGALNYYSAKKWLEDQLDGSDGSLLQDVSLVLNLDSLSSSSALTLHVSKPPKAGGAAHSLKQRLKAPVNHKKINLADELLAWQHERFSIRRLTAFTLSSMQSHKDPAKSTVLDTPKEQAILNLVANVRRTARALASHIYNLTSEDNDQDSVLYDDVLGVDEESIRSWYNYLTSSARAPQLLTVSGPAPAAGVTSALERALSRYVGEVSVTSHAIDKRDPEYALYGPTKATLHVYNVKPAVFDLILTLAIVAYLTVVYFILQIFPRFYEEYAKLVTGKAKVH